jgi:hypothetical protein
LAALIAAFVHFCIFACCSYLIKILKNILVQLRTQKCVQSSFLFARAKFDFNGTHFFHKIVLVEGPLNVITDNVIIRFMGSKGPRHKSSFYLHEPNSILIALTFCTQQWKMVPVEEPLMWSLIMLSLGLCDQETKLQNMSSWTNVLMYRVGSFIEHN